MVSERIKNIPNIWIVDDDDDDLFSMKLAADEIDHVRFSFFSSGQEMLDHTKTICSEANYPHVVLLDLNMPMLNGVETMKKFKEIALKSINCDHIPFVMHSNSNNSIDVNRSYLHGANGYMVKAQTLSKLIEDFKNVKSYWTDVNVV